MAADSDSDSGMRSVTPSSEMEEYNRVLVTSTINHTFKYKCRWVFSVPVSKTWWNKKDVHSRLFLDYKSSFCKLGFQNVYKPPAKNPVGRPVWSAFCFVGQGLNNVRGFGGKGLTCRTIIFRSFLDWYMVHYVCFEKNQNPTVVNLFLN